MHNLLLKKTVRLLFLFFVQMSLTQSLLAQKEKVTNPVADSTEEYYTDNFLRYDNHTYKKTIHSVQLINKAADMSSPMIRFGSDDQLKL